MSVYCPCGSKMSKTTAKQKYNYWVLCGSCTYTISVNDILYHCSNKECFDFCESCCESGRPQKTKKDLKYSWEVQPFANGGCRYAYLGIALCGKLKGQKIVAKKFMDKRAYALGDWDLDLKASAKAKQFVLAWNKLSIIDKKYVFHDPDIRTVKIHPKGYDDEKHCQVGEFVMIEKYIAGHYEKWNDNSGGVNLTSASIQAFCHWTYHYSNKTLLLCDAQGVRSYDAYYLTDPAIHSLWQGYGDTDWGIEGIKDFFSTHICNEFCDKKWSTYNTIKRVARKTKSTSYRWKTGLK
eukprot:81436_1